MYFLNLSLVVPLAIEAVVVAVVFVVIVVVVFIVVIVRLEAVTMRRALNGTFESLSHPNLISYSILQICLSGFELAVFGGTCFPLIFRSCLHQNILRPL